MKELTNIEKKEIQDTLPQALHANQLLHAEKPKLEVYQSLIDLKRDREALQTERRPLFFWIGMSLSLLMVVVAFNWKTYDDGAIVDLGDLNDDFDEMIEAPLSVQPPPPPPQKIEVFLVKEVEDDVIIEEVDIQLDVETSEDMALDVVIFDDIELESEEEVAEEIFQIVEDAPTFPGGLKAFYTYIAENIQYPGIAKRMGVSGRVYLRFVIEKDGQITDISVVKGIGQECDEEAVRVLQNSPRWNPGRQRGNKVRVWMTVPIHFMLKD